MDLATSGCGLVAGCVEWVLLGNGDGTFQMAQFFGNGTPPLQGAAPLATADFNDDGKLDWVLGDPPRYDIAAIHLGNGEGTFATSSNSYQLGSNISLDQNAVGIATGDFNGDGKQDIAASNVVLLGNGDGTFQGTQTAPPKFVH